MRDTVAHEMTDKVPVVPSTYTVEETMRYLAENLDSFEFIDSIFVVDKDKKLQGISSQYDAYRAKEGANILSTCKKSRFFIVHPDTDKEEAAYAALKRKVSDIPVVAKDHTFLGVIPAYRVMAILHRELKEDILQMAGIHKSHASYDNILEIPVSVGIMHRLPWLLVGVGGGVLAAEVIGLFEWFLAEHIMVAAFLPLIVYLADAVGTQVEVFTIRDLVVFQNIRWGVYIRKHVLIAGSLAGILGMILFGTALALGHPFAFALTLALSIIIAVFTALFLGILFPLLVRYLQQDPANVSGPIGTILRDLISVIVYLVIAISLL